MKRCTTIVREESNKWIYEHAYIEKSCENDGVILGPNLRQADKDEIQAAVGKEAREVLVESIRLSGDTGYTVKDLETDEPLACFGTAPFDMNTGVVWFLGSNELFKKSRISFLRNSEFWVEKLFGDFDILFNAVDSRNKVHIRWLKWLGFEFIADIPEFGVEKRMFHQFMKCK